MNFFEGRIAEIGPGRAVVDLPGFGPLPFAISLAGMTIGQAICLAFRPERFLLGREAIAGTDCRVRNKAYFGNRTNYQVEAPGRPQLLTVSSANDAGHVKRGLEIGEEIRLLPEPDGAILLPASP
jgi:ABC-type Fe3+/spermidine/putrescine transport system ATPase subunit